MEKNKMKGFDDILEITNSKDKDADPRELIKTYKTQKKQNTSNVSETKPQKDNTIEKSNQMQNKKVTTESGIEIENKEIPKALISIEGEVIKKDTEKPKEAKQIKVVIEEPKESEQPKVEVKNTITESENLQQVNETNKKETERKPIENKVQKKVSTESGIEVDSKDIPSKLVNVEGGVIKKDTEKSEEEKKTITSEVKAEKEKSIPEKEIKVNKITESETTQKDFIEIEEAKSVKKKKKININIQKITKYLSLLLFCTMTLLIFISIKNNENIVNLKSDNIPNVFQKILVLKTTIGQNIPQDINKIVPTNILNPTNLTNTGEKKSDLDITKEKSLNNSKPINYFSLLKTYNTYLSNSPNYPQYRDKKYTLLLHQVLLESNPKTSVTIEHEGKNYPANAIITGWAIVCKNETDFSKIKKDETKIQLAIESAFYNKDKKEILKLKENKELVSFLIERVSGVQVEVDIIVIAGNLK